MTEVIPRPSLWDQPAFSSERSVAAPCFDLNRIRGRGRKTYLSVITNKRRWKLHSNAAALSLSFPMPISFLHPAFIREAYHFAPNRSAVSIKARQKRSIRVNPIRDESRWKHRPFLLFFTGCHGESGRLPVRPSRRQVPCSSGSPRNESARRRRRSQS